MYSIAQQVDLYSFFISDRNIDNYSLSSFVFILKIVTVIIVFHPAYSY